MNFVGIDPSLSGCGIVKLDQNSNIVEEVELKAGKQDDPERFMEMWKRVRKYLNPTTDKILIEGFSYGSSGAGVSKLYGLGWLFRIRMVEECFAWQEVPPTSLKKFACNNGRAKKDALVLPIYKKWEYENSSDNIRDAYVLARMAWSMYNHDNLLSYEKEVLKKIKKV